MICDIMSEEYALTWNNYSNYLTSRLNGLREDECYIDVTLYCEGQKLGAHKLFLASCSSWFKKVFQDNPCKHPVVVLHGITFEDLRSLITFMYCGEVCIPQHQIASFMSAAEILQVSGIGNSEMMPNSNTNVKESENYISDNEVESVERVEDESRCNDSRRKKMRTEPELMAVDPLELAKDSLNENECSNEVSHLPEVIENGEVALGQVQHEEETKNFYLPQDVVEAIVKKTVPCPLCGLRFNKRKDVGIHLRLSHKLQHSQKKKYLDLIKSDCADVIATESNATVEGTHFLHSAINDVQNNEHSQLSVMSKDKDHADTTIPSHTTAKRHSITSKTESNKYYKQKRVSKGKNCSNFNMYLSDFVSENASPSLPTKNIESVLEYKPKRIPKKKKSDDFLYYDVKHNNNLDLFSYSPDGRIRACKVVLERLDLNACIINQFGFRQ